MVGRKWWMGKEDRERNELETSGWDRSDRRGRGSSWSENGGGGRVIHYYIYH